MSSKTDVVIKLALVFFISLLSFSIGTFVGKKYSDNQHQLTALEPQNSHSSEREIASEPAHSPTHSNTHKPGAMTDDEIAKLAEEFVADETTPISEVNNEHANHDTHDTQAATTTHHQAPAPTEKAASHHEEPSAAAKSVATGTVPGTHAVEHKAVVKEERRPSSLPKDVAQFAVGKFTVQVASYASEVEAQKMASDLKGKGYSAFYIPANIKGKTWFRVSVGQFATQKEAQSYRSELINNGKVSSAIVQKITE